MTEIQALEGQIIAPGDWSPSEAAAHVSEAWQNAVDSIVETGRRLIEAKQRVGHGNWLPTVEMLPFSERTAQMLIRVAQHPDLANPNHGADLPPSWRTLAVLAQLPPGEIPKRIEAGEITPELDRATAQSRSAASRSLLSRRLKACRPSPRRCTTGRRERGPAAMGPATGRPRRRSGR